MTPTQHPEGSRGGRLLPLLLLLLTLFAGCGEPPTWNVLVVTFDTTRPDFLGCYGKASARTPNLDRLATEGTLFLEAMSTAPITLPSHSTIFTGLYPIAHGVRDNGLFQLPPSRTTLAEVLKEAGYATAAAIGAFPLTRDFGLDQGFDLYDDHITVAAENFRGQRIDAQRGVFFDERPATQVNDAILPWLREAAPAGPFFAWIHYWDPHHPLHPPAPFDQLYRHDPYQGEIAYADHSLGTVLRELEKLGVYERTLIVIAGDHGEGRGEHNEDSHSLLAYNATLHVPLIMRVPGLEGGRRVAQRVGTVDVLPTVLDLLELPIPDKVQGRSLEPVIRAADREPASRGLYYAETLSPRLSHGWGELRALYEGAYKYIHGPRPELYDLEEDPGELHDLSTAQPEEAARMHQALAAFLERRASSNAADAVHEIDHETRQRLAALGYISSQSEAPGTVSEVLRSDGIPPQDRIGDVSLSSRVKQHMDQKDYLQAKELSLHLIDRDPDNAYYRGLLALSYLGLGQFENAARTVEEAESIVALNDGVFLNVATELFARGEYQRGLAITERVVAAHETAYGHYLLGEMYGALGRHDEKIAALTEALDIDPRYTRARLSLAIDHASRGETEEAEEDFQIILRQQPMNHRAHLNFAILLLKNKAGRWDEAVAHLERATELNPTYWQAYLALLAVHVERQEHDAAASLFARLEQRCQNPRILAQARAMMEAVGSATT